ncbi:MAG: tetratricopeptide repeat protein, partial [Planktothrix sp.]
MKNRNLILGNQLMRSGKLEDAVAAYEIAIASHPSFPWSHYQLGQALEKLGRWEDALVAYQKAI